MSKEVDQYEDNSYKLELSKDIDYIKEILERSHIPSVDTFDHECALDMIHHVLEKLVERIEAIELEIEYIGNTFKFQDQNLINFLQKTLDTLKNNDK